LTLVHRSAMIARVGLYWAKEQKPEEEARL
jgi:hypothetical protein